MEYCDREKDEAQVQTEQGQWGLTGMEQGDGVSGWKSTERGELSRVGRLLLNWLYRILAKSRSNAYTTEVRG